MNNRIAGELGATYTFSYLNSLLKTTFFNFRKGLNIKDSFQLAELDAKKSAITELTNSLVFKIVSLNSENSSWSKDQILQLLTYVVTNINKSNLDMRKYIKTVGKNSLKEISKYLLRSPPPTAREYYFKTNV